MKKEITSNRRHELLREPYLKQTEIAQILGCSPGHVSKILKEQEKAGKILNKNPFGLGYKTKDVINFFELDKEQIFRDAEKEIKLKGGDENGKTIK